VKLAGRDFQLALDLDPKFADAYLGRAALASAQKRPADAVREAEQALRVGDPTPRILFGVARVHALARTDAGDSRALELLRSALEALPATQRRGFVVRYIDRDAALAPLRQQPRFEQLLRQVSAGGPR
jgi:tetratricopeptide (TPR) repeat protein